MGEDSGRVLVVLETFMERCRHPSCTGQPHDVRYFALERDWFVAECGRTGFSWLRV